MLFYKGIYALITLLTAENIEKLNKQLLKHIIAVKMIFQILHIRRFLKYLICIRPAVKVNKCRL